MLVAPTTYAGRFRADQLIEATGPITTWHGWDLQDDRPVVLKVASGLARDRQLRLIYEAQLLGRLESPHIVPVLATGRENDDYFVAMPQAGEQTLRQKLDSGALSVPEALTLGLGLFRALEVVHEHGLFHRDLKPENILLDQPLTRAVLIDFGMAAELGPAGSPAYMAPERLGLLDRTADERSDLYEGGLVLYEALAGRLPFPGGQSDLLRAKMVDEPPSLCGLRPEIMPALDSVVLRLLQKEPEQRYQHASSVAHDLEELLAGRAPLAGSTDPRRKLTEPVLVGREAELGQLEDCLRQASLGAVRLVRVSGASGSGKTRLLEEFAKSSRAAGLRVLVGRAQSSSAQAPFQQLEPVFRQLAEEIEPETDLLEQIRPWGEVLGIALESFRRLYPSSQTPEDPQVIRAARRVLTRMPGRTVLILDDCQWSHGALFELIDDCLERKASMLIVAASRDDLPKNHHLQSYQQAPLIRVGGLSKVATRRLLESMAGALPEAAIEWVWSASLGDPFMAEATLRGLVECRALKSAEGSWKVAAENESVARISRRGALILAERLTTLTPAALTVIQAGAVVGRRFQPGMVAAVTGIALEQVASAVQEARRRHLVWRSEDGLSYQFAHDRILESVLEQIPPTQMAAMHRTVAQRFLAQAEDRNYEVAYHYGRAGEWREAFPYALRAAEMARKTLAPEVAQEYYKIAEKGIEQADSRTRLRLFMGLGEVLALRGRYAEAESYYFQAREYRDDNMTGADIESRLATIYGFTDPVACRQAADRALHFLGRSIPANLLASTLKELVVATSRIFRSPNLQVGGSQQEADLLGKICHALGTAGTTDGNKAAAILPLLYGMNSLERLPPTSYLAAIYGNLAVGLALVGLPALAAPMSAKAQRKAEAAGQVLALGQVLARRQVLRLAQGSFGEVVAEFDQTMSLIEPSGDAWEIATAKTHAGLAFYYRGHLKVAFEMGLEGLREARREADLLNVGSSIRLCALAGLGYRHFEEIPERAEPLVKAFHAFADGLYQLYSGKPEKAILPLKKATDLGHMGFHTAPFSAWLVTAYRQTAEALPPEGVHLAGQFLRLARNSVSRALSEGKRHTVSYPHALRESALLAARQGLEVRARKQFDRALGVAKRHEMDYELAWALIERGRVGSAFGWPGAERDIGHGRSLLARLEAWLPGEKPEEKPVPVLSVVDRFSKVLESGRRIAASLDVPEIRQLLAQAALALLRCQDCRVLDAGNLPNGEFSTDLVGEASRVGRTVLRDEGLPEDLSESLLLSGVRSALCAPVLVHGQVDCLLYVTHQLVGQLFGEEERRIGDYLASLAGAALENAQNFRERQKANQRFETLFRWTGVGTAVVTREGKITDANPFFEQMLGLPEGVLLDAIFHGDRGLVEEGWQRLFEEGQPLRLEVRCLRASGELLWAQLTASRPPGEDLAIAAFSDVSHRRLEQVAAFQESERRLLAAELHDGVSQPLAALYFQLQTAAVKAKGQQADDLQGCVSQTQAILMEISQLMFDLRNPTSGEVDAVRAALELCQGFASETGIEVDAQASGGEVKGLAGTFLFRLVQEALTNVRKHAQASRVEVRLRVSDREVHGQVSDNGQGFDPSQVAKRATRHYGLQGMRERAELLGGSWEITSEAGGTGVEFRLPLG